MVRFAVHRHDVQEKGANGPRRRFAPGKGRFHDMSIIDHTLTDRAPPVLDLAGTALFLDLDGTLAPIVARPQDVGPDPRRTAILADLVRRMDGRVAILSGRTLAEIDHILDSAVRPADVAAAFQDLAARSPGLLVETKGLSVALHYRQAPDQAADVLALAQQWSDRTGLKLQPGHMVVELRTPGPDKGDSLATFMAAAPFKGAIPVFVGDDLTDEPAFRAARDLGGAGVLVGPRRNSAATHRLEDVSAVLDWLEAAL